MEIDKTHSNIGTVVKTRNTSEAVLRPQYIPLSHHTDCGPMGLGQYNSLGEYCGPHTALSVFLILVHILAHIEMTHFMRRMKS